MQYYSQQTNSISKLNRIAFSMFFISVLIAFAGCQQPLGFGDSSELGNLFQRSPSFAALTAKASDSAEQILKTTPVEDRLAILSGEQNVFAAKQGTYAGLPSSAAANSESTNSNPRVSNFSGLLAGTDNNSLATSTVSGLPTIQQPIVRAQSPSYGSSSQNQFAGGATQDDSKVQPAAFQYPELATPGRSSVPGNDLPSINVGSPNEMNPMVQPFERGGNAPFPSNYADLDIYVTETQTGRINFGGAYNSDNGIVGQFIVNETNFDITRVPRNFREIFDGTAWRGAGQTFRLEIVPGAQLERYLVNFSEPYIFGTDYTFSMSAYLFTRQYYDWNEKRVGGKFSLGRRLTQDLSITAGLRLEDVTIDDPRVNTSTKLNNSVGNSNLNLFNVGLVRDTRDSQFQATEGSYLSLGYSQAFGDYSYSRGDLDMRRYKLLYERPDGSGRHTLSMGTKLGFSGKSTPIFENYFAGGFSTLRGYDFRGAAPLDGGVRVGGAFQWLNTVEYMFPVTADDMVKGVLFCDFGTVEENVELNSENFRVAPGFGFRIHMPGAGIGAPLAFDFAFPVSSAAGDEEKVFSFYLGVLR